MPDAIGSNRSSESGCFPHFNTKPIKLHKVFFVIFWPLRAETLGGYYIVKCAIQSCFDMRMKTMIDWFTITEHLGVPVWGFSNLDFLLRVKVLVLLVFFFPFVEINMKAV